MWKGPIRRRKNNKKKKSRTGPLSDSPSVACDEESLIDMIQVTSYFLFLSERVKLVLSGKAPRALNENKSATFAITWKHMTYSLSVYSDGSCTSAQKTQKAFHSPFPDLKRLEDPFHLSYQTSPSQILLKENNIIHEAQ